jgi:phage major head subunit gpT-like protein
MATQEQFLEWEGNIQKTWQAVTEAKKDYSKLLFNQAGSTRAQENHRSLGTSGMMVDWDGQVSYDDIANGYASEYRHGKKSTGVQIQRELFDDKEYQQIKAYVKAKAYGVHKTLQYDAVSVLNNAFSSSYTGPDSVALCNASHHNVPGDDAQSNTDTLDLNVPNLETVRNRMTQFKDDRGDIMEVFGNLLIVGDAWHKTAKQIVGSEKEAYTADNQINADDDLNYLYIPRITGNKWFLVNKDEMLNGSGFNWYTRRDPRKLERDMSNPNGDFDYEIYKWKAVGRWSYGWDNWFFIYGNNPA